MGGAREWDEVPPVRVIRPQVELGEGAEATDAFAQEWRGELAWAHPPPGLLPHPVDFLEVTGAAATLLLSTFRSMLSRSPRGAALASRSGSEVAGT